MSGFNSAKAVTKKPTAALKTLSSIPDATTHQGGQGFAYDEKTELFLLGVQYMVGEDTFYESAETRKYRFGELVQKVAVADGEWTLKFLTWLRGEANVRTAAIMGAAEAVRARLKADIQGGNRELVRAVLQRADEPGEMVAYWEQHYGSEVVEGRRKAQLPKPVKRGIADAVGRLYTEYAAFKYDTAGKGKRFADILELTHASGHTAKQDELFRWLLDRRRGRDGDKQYPMLSMKEHRDALAAIPQNNRRAILNRSAEKDTVAMDLKKAGVTWEWLASWLGGTLDAAFWEAVIPSMGYMALLRNLRNFDQAGVSDKVAQWVIEKLTDPDEVAKSRQFPMRFLSAYRAAPSLRWSYPLEQAMDLSLGGIPTLTGRTLILVDTSQSMDIGFSKDGTLKRWDAAALFGIALGQRCEKTDVVSFSNGYWNTDPTKVFNMKAGESLLKSVERWKSGGFFINGGTDTVGAVRKHFADHDRVVILTDEQVGSLGRNDVGSALPAKTPLYTWNLAGYGIGHAPSGHGRRFTFGGLNDASFRMVPLIERGAQGAWPWAE